MSGINFITFESLLVATSLKVFRVLLLGCVGFATAWLLGEPMIEG